MKPLTTLMVVCCFLLPLVAWADSSDDTLEFFLRKSDLVVIGQIKNEPSAIIKEVGVLNYVCDFEVSDVLKGDKTLNAKTIKINIVRFEMNEKDRNPLIRKDSECIVFLKMQPDGNAPRWETADFWFGIQNPSPWMAKSVKRLGKCLQSTRSNRVHDS
jgi:hypothetical protein